MSQNGLLGLYRGYTMGATREGGSMQFVESWVFDYPVPLMKFVYMIAIILTSSIMHVTDALPFSLFNIDQLSC